VGARHPPRAAPGDEGPMDCPKVRTPAAIAAEVRRARSSTMDTKLEVVVLPVSDVDKAKQFYQALGWREDGDHTADGAFRVVQMTPPGSQASVIFGSGITDAEPGSVHDVLLAVDDIEKARADIAERGIEIGEVWHDADAFFYRSGGRNRVPGPDPRHRTYSSFATFKDPDGNSWVLQEVTSRPPGRLWSDFGTDVAALAELLRDAEEHHGTYEPTAPEHHWSNWYAPYIVARRLGHTPEEAYQEASAALEASLR
jgi:catechol 2,3-dioxygenase-like lactoylglutathione lyase family enzyme